MSLKGRLEDISIVDILQLLHMSKRSGTLRLVRGLDTADIVFAKGAIVAASSTSVPITFTDILRQAGALDNDDTMAALTIQKSEASRRPLGHILLEMGAVTEEQLGRAIEKMIVTVIQEVLAWRDGEFALVPDTREGYLHASFFPTEFAVPMCVDTQNVIMEALRLFDEKNHRAGGQGAGDEGAGDETAEVDRLFTQFESVLQGKGGRQRDAAVVFTPDGFLRNTIKAAAQSEEWIVSVPAAEAEFLQRVDELADPALRPPVIVIDAAGAEREGDGRLSLAAGILARHPGLQILVITGDGAPCDLAEVYRSGVARVLAKPPVEGGPGHVEAMNRFNGLLTACLAGMFAANAGCLRHRDELVTRYARLKEWVLEINRHRSSATVSLSVLRYVAEHIDRSVLFMNQESALKGIGAFGCSSDGAVQDLSTLVLKMRIPLDGAATFRDVVARQAVHLGQIDDTAEGRYIYGIIGRPAYPKALLLPITIMGRVALIVYCDNGRKNEAFENTLSPLEVVAQFAGLVLENSLLRVKVKNLQET